MADPLHVLDEQVDRLGRPTGAAGGQVPGEDLGLPGAHGAGQAGQLHYPDTVCPAVEAVEGRTGRWHAVRGVDRAQQLLALPGDGDLAEPITGSQSRAQPRSATAGELFGGGQQQLADVVQRIVLAPAVTKEGLLGPPADLVDHRVGQPDGVEVIDNHGGVAKRSDQGAGVAAPGVQRDRGHPASQGRGRAPSQAVTARWCGQR